MLFPTEDDVDHIWRIVCNAVVSNRLGHSAKVAAEPASSIGREGPGSESRRLICVYTYNYTDMADVQRVLDALVELGLCPAEGNGIYYKCDAFTMLGIDSGNQWGLKASLYSSRDLLGGKQGMR